MDTNIEQNLQSLSDLITQHQKFLMENNEGTAAGHLLCAAVEVEKAMLILMKKRLDFLENK